MTYNPSIPQATDNISVSQGQILNNFTQLNTQFGIDHVPYFTGSINGSGWHKQSTYIDQTPTMPPPTSLAGQNTVYALKSTMPQTITSLKYQHDATGTVFTLNPIKAYALISTPSVNTATLVEGFNIASVSLSGAILTVTITDTMNTTGTGIYAVMAYGSIGTAARWTVISPTQFSISTSGVGAGFYYTVIALGL